MSDDQPFILSEEAAARKAGISFGTLRNLRKRGALPQGLYVRPSPKRIVYLVHLLERWLELGCPRVWPPGEPRPAA